ncbi:uncharacterized protein LOC110459998 [Mizuhopecten yessoensis]|uniref:Uncharacterized protein n=1 Tax=Mizuhopecten yessoensis TaxID=6573 RepID=A0A210Q3B8_MIZYE|nr:uncharacterized protein LOC110459998 [Mizuhopecten yessoensis]OWF43205.1 hypothetical protein KP79_PYT01896 [Mizuhopecten yessoensis]
MYEPYIIIALFVVYTAMLAIWLPPGRISALLIKISSDVKKNRTTSFLIVGICIWILAIQTDNNQTKNRLISIEAKLEDMDAYVISQNREMNQMEKRFNTLLEAETLVLKDTFTKILEVEVENLLMKARNTDENIETLTIELSEMEQNIETANREMAKTKKQMDTLVEKEILVLKTDLNKKNNKILGKLRETDKILEDLDESKRTTERKVEKGEAVFRHLKDYVKDQDDKNYQFKEDVDTLYQMYNRIQEKRENSYRSHQERENERQRDVARKPSLVVRVINQVINVAVHTVGSYVGGAIFKAVSWVGSWLGIT